MLDSGKSDEKEHLVPTFAHNLNGHQQKAAGAAWLMSVQLLVARIKG